jgi:uncharacterized protein (TIGR02246 family)
LEDLDVGLYGNPSTGCACRNEIDEKTQEESMKTRILGALVGLAISFTLPTFAQQKDAVDQKTLQQLDAKIKKYDEAVNNNDAAAVAALFTEDAVFVTDGGLLHGRQAVEKQYAEWFKGWHHSDHIGKRDPDSTRFLGSTDYVMLGGEWSETNQAQGEQPFQLKGYWSAVDTRVGDAWKIRILTYNRIPPPPAPAQAK